MKYVLPSILRKKKNWNLTQHQPLPLPRIPAIRITAVPAVKTRKIIRILRAAIRTAMRIPATVPAETSGLMISSPITGRKISTEH